MQNKFQMRRVKQFQGTRLSKKYTVDRLVGIGSFGNVYKVKNIHDQNAKPLVVKASRDAVMLHNEITALDSIHKYVKGH